MARNIGMNVKLPKKECNDKKCPFHGNLKCHGKSFTGTVISTRMQKAVNVEWAWKRYIPKYERYEKRRTRVKAHQPPCIEINEGDVVKIAECRQLSKTKNFVVTENLGKEKGFEERKEALEASKFKKEEKRKPEKVEEGDK